MEAAKLDVVSVRFNGKNFALWEFQFRVFVQGRRLLAILDGTSSEPASDATTKIKDDWAANNAQIISWLLSSVESGVALSLRGFTTAHEMWKHLTDLYTQTSASRKFDIEYEIAHLHQGDRDVSTYYQAAVTLWTEHDLLTASTNSSKVSAEVVKEQSSTRLMQFLMKLRPDFEGVRASLLHRNVTSMETALAELIREETSQSKLDLHSTDSTVVGAAFAVHSSKPKFHRTSTGEIICHFCHEPGHILPHCKKRNTCNYCKKPCHLIGDCPILARRGRTKSSGTSSQSGSAYATAAVPAASSGMTPEDVRRLIQEALEDALPSALTSAFSTGMISRSSPTWHLDSAAYNHMTNARCSFTTMKSAPPIDLQVADGSRLQVKGIGHMVHQQLSLLDTLFVPKLVPNLVSVGQLTEDGCRIIFDATGCTVQDTKTGREIGRGSKHGRTFSLDSYLRQNTGELTDEKDARTLVGPSGRSSDMSISAKKFSNSKFLVDGHVVSDSVSGSVSGCSSFSVNLSDWNLWHHRLGHPNDLRLCTMFRNKWLSGNGIFDQNHKCVHCLQAKFSQRSFSTSTTVYSEPFELVHTDLWGPSPVTSRMGFRYFVLFVDHATRFTWVYFLRQKSDLLPIAREFIQMVSTQFGKQIKIIRSDPGGEFISNQLQELFKEKGILPQQSCPGVSQQNGLVERKNRHVLELTHTILFHSCVPPSFWVEAVHTVVHLINRQITPILKERSPYQVMYSRTPDYSKLKVFGCVCYVLLAKRERHKLSPKAAKCVFFCRIQ
ncbi:Retrovirus-related Pol polyprotein from transposon RE1 [Linum grandiflorum]